MSTADRALQAFQNRVDPRELRQVPLLELAHHDPRVRASHVDDAGKAGLPDAADITQARLSSLRPVGHRLSSEASGGG